MITSTVEVETSKQRRLSAEQQDELRWGPGESLRSVAREQVIYDGLDGRTASGAVAAAACCPDDPPAALPVLGVLLQAAGLAEWLLLRGYSWPR